MRLVLVRHGESHHSRDGVIAELTGCGGLTEQGVKQVSLLASRLSSTGEGRGVHSLLSSPVLRARETAQILADALAIGPVVGDRGLCELHPGLADGLSWDAYSTTFGDFDLMADPQRPFAPNGESWVGFLDRVGETLERLATTFDDQTLVAVTMLGSLSPPSSWCLTSLAPALELVSTRPTPP